jgi:catechol 2,3-dioxygenase-like lactoylglutathione lyase family enzyme
VSLIGLTHVALHVTDLRDAEEYYRELFRLEVAFREAPTDEGWATLPEGASWDDSPAELQLTMLFRDGFRLALERADDVAPQGQLSHVGIQVDAEELDALRDQIDAVVDNDRALVFDDRFGVRWELNTFPYDDPRSLSTGERSGRWLEGVAS